METVGCQPLEEAVVIVLLPIREAYEWKRFLCRAVRLEAHRTAGFLLPIREAYEWKPYQPVRILRILSHLASNS